MKLRFYPFLIGIAALWMYTGCDRIIEVHEPANPPGRDFSKAIQAIVSPAILDSLKKNGQPIYDGQQPPNIEGIYVLAKNLIVGSNLANDQDSLNVKLFSDYKYRFYEQTNKNTKIKADHKATSGVSSGFGSNGLVSGKGNFFTVFIETTVTSDVNRNGKKYTVTALQLDTYSGEITPNGIKNFVISFYMKEKSDDPEKGIVKVGTVRVFKDKDGFSEKTNTF